MFSDHYQVDTGDGIYTVVDDLTTRFNLLFAGRVTSATSTLPLPQFSVRVDRPDVYVKVMRDGFFCLAGAVETLFPHLDSQAYNLTVDISSDRFQPTSIGVPIPIGSTFPLTPLDVALDYEPVRIEGRVVLDLDGSPVLGARITIDEPDTATLRTPLHFEHAMGTTVRPCSLSNAGAARTLTEPIGFLEEGLVLDNNAGLLPGSVLRLGVPALFEFVIVDNVGPGAGEVSLRGGTRRSYPAGTDVQPVTPAPGAPPRALVRAVPAGGGFLFLDGPLTGTDLVVEDADPARLEYHARDALSEDVAEREGYYRLDGIYGIHSLTLHAEDLPVTHQMDLAWTVDPRRPVNVVNLRLT